MIRYSLFLVLFFTAACGVKGVEETEQSQRDTTPTPVVTDQTQETVVYRDIDMHRAGGEAHEHGAAEMAVTIDAKKLTISLDAPLANFGLQEGGDAVDLKGQGFSEGMVDLVGDAQCVPTGSSVKARQSGDHGSLSLEMNWTCERIAKLTAVKLNAFERYPGGFEKVSAILFSGKRQISSKLTSASPTILID